METKLLRSEVSEFINTADAHFLKMVHAMALAYAGKPIVAHTADGIPLTAIEYEQELVAAEKGITNKQSIPTTTLKEHIKTWQKRKV